MFTEAVYVDFPIRRGTMSHDRWRGVVRTCLPPMSVAQKASSVPPGRGILVLRQSEAFLKR